MSKEQLNQHAPRLHADVSFNAEHKVSLSDISKFERFLDIKIIVFHHNSGTKQLDLYQTCEQIYPKTVWLYLHDDHFYLSSATNATQAKSKQ